ncbi:MAG: hypothetical protein V4736_13145 [Bdellovibrionota bacterium]
MSIGLLAHLSLSLVSLFHFNIAYAAFPKGTDKLQANYACTIQGENKAASLQITTKANNFEIIATTGQSTIFKKSNQRPSLNVRIEDGTSSTVNEYVDFNDTGLETVPIEAAIKLEVDLKPSSTLVHHSEGAKLTKLNCAINPTELLTFLGIAPRASVIFPNVNAVAFDIDDTLAFTSPAFVRGFATGGVPKPDDIIFWTQTNGCDGGCKASVVTLNNGAVKTLPANLPSTPKAKALELIAYHKSLGHKVYAITARPDINGQPLREYFQSQMGIAKEDIFFEPDIDQPGNPAGKTDRIEKLNLDVFYGDSDSDITDALKAFRNESGVRTKLVHPVRFFRSPKSSNRKSGELNKYHPGYYGEPILSGSY